MLRTPKLPKLPGYSFDRELGQTRFHKSTQFELLRGEIPYLSEAQRPGTGGYPVSWTTPDFYPSVYPRREDKELPSWVVFDKQVLSFDAYFQQAVCEVDRIPYQIRKVKILFFLEDGTIQVNEPRVDNSGMTQGTLISRQRIRFPKPMDNNFYEMIDFNIGKNVELYGKVFRIVDCDIFTRQFLNRLGIFVGDRLEYPDDPHTLKEEKKKYDRMGRKPRKTSPERGKYIEYDKCVLKFFGYWDDRSSMYGSVHKLEIYYFLADDTIEIKEVAPVGSSRKEKGSIFLKRGKLTKSFDYLCGLGDNDKHPLLNVFSTGFLRGRYVVDPVTSGAAKLSFYQEKDLAIGAYLNVYGRKVVLTDCDPYTRDYYRVKYGMDTFQKLDIPDAEYSATAKEFEMPPWNGIGSFEDSAGNCRKIIPEPPKKDFYKMLVKGRVGLDSHILRFTAKMISFDSNNDIRNFIISYYLNTDCVSIYERAARNSGFISQVFLSKREIFKPDQEMFVSKKPDIYLKDDFWIGNVLNLEGFSFRLTGADDYCLRYMELNSRDFPKSNINLILDKIRENLRPVYKDFMCKYLRPCVDNMPQPEVCTNILSYEQLKTALHQLLGDNITEHEIITLARHYRAQCPPIRKHEKDVILNACRQECRKQLWYGLDRLSENLRYQDPCRTGFLSSQVAFSLCKGARIPIENELLTSVFEVVNKNECGDVSIEDLLHFFGERAYCEQPTVPFNHKREFSDYYKSSERVKYSWIDCNSLIKDLGLQEELAKNEQNT